MESWKYPFSFWVSINNPYNGVNIIWYTKLSISIKIYISIGFWDIIIMAMHTNITIEDNRNDDFKCLWSCKYFDAVFAIIFSKYCNATIIPTKARDSPETYKYSGSINSIKNEKMPVKAWYILKNLLSLTTVEIFVFCNTDNLLLISL